MRAESFLNLLFRLEDVMTNRTARTALLLIAALLAACSTTGPEIIRGGRPAYNDAILSTNDEQLLQNVVRMRFPERGAAGKGIRIMSSSSQPSQVRVAAQYHGRWYYIDQTDESSKQWFSMMGLLANAQVPDTGIGPLLTLPAGKH